MTTWLPDIMPFSGDWDSYVDEIYEVFEQDVRSTRFLGHRVSRRRTPEVKGKPDGFWHVTSEHFRPDDLDRIPDLRRCERVPWIGPMISAAGDTECVLCFRSPRQVRFGHNVVVVLPDYTYAVILGQRTSKDGSTYFVLVTAFPLGKRRAEEFKADYARFGEYAPE